MKLPYLWLCDLVKVPGDAASVADALASRGFEVASITPLDGARGKPLDAVIDFEITANRPDCLNVIGLAREASAAFGVPLQFPERGMPPAGQPHPIDIVIEDAELCPRYCAQVFEVRASAHTPAWMRDRLEACGMRSISAIVDVTNYVLLETGQPTHAFDYAKLAGRTLRIRRATPGEKITTLDGVDRALDADMLVIADGERPQAVAGVMGGARSEIGAGTKLMVLESACFKPGSVRRTSKALGLKTEASTRFERGADINAAPAAIERIATLLQQIGAAQPLGPTIDKYPSPRQPLVLELRAARIERVLGMHVADEDVPRILEPLGFSVSSSDIDRRSLTVGHRWSVIVPSFRVDVLREIDLIEEVARHDGYKGLPATFPELSAAQPAPDPRTLRDRLLRQILTACGFSEAMTFAFIEAAAAAPFTATDGAERPLVAVANPLSEKFAVLRPSLLPGLIDAAAHNWRRQQTDIRLFETGTRFSVSGETRAVAGVWAGSGSGAHWSGAARPADFFDVKGVVDALATELGAQLEFAPAEISYLVPGRSASVSVGERAIGVIGQLSPALLEARGFGASEPLWAFEIETDAPAHGAADLRAQSLPRFPSIVRDLSVLVDGTLPAAAVRGTIRSSAPATLVHAIEFDRYTGKGVPDDRVSLSLRLTFRSPERTLTDGEIDAAMDGIVSALVAAHGAVRR